MIDQVDMMAVVQKYRGDAVVIPAERAAVQWPLISTNQPRDVSGEIMGKCSSLALGVCLAQPDTKVIVFDGDGSLEMNLGTLVTIGEAQPRNLYHFVLENGMYATTGGQPIPGKDKVSFTELAKGAGYAAIYTFDDLEEFTNRAQEVLNQPGPVLISVKTVPNPRPRDVRFEDETNDPRPGAQVMTDLRKDFGVK
jgi:phosphonopyruvate decarboxylase